MKLSDVLDLLENKIMCWGEMFIPASYQVAVQLNENMLKMPTPVPST